MANTTIPTDFNNIMPDLTAQNMKERTSARISFDQIKPMLITASKIIQNAVEQGYYNVYLSNIDFDFNIRSADWKALASVLSERQFFCVRTPRGLSMKVYWNQH